MPEQMVQTQIKLCRKLRVIAPDKMLFFFFFNQYVDTCCDKSADNEKGKYGKE